MDSRGAGQHNRRPGNPSDMKFLFDFLPLLVFFAGYAAVDIFFATAAAMAATAFQISWSWLRHRKAVRRRRLP